MDEEENLNPEPPPGPQEPAPAPGPETPADFAPEAPAPAPGAPAELERIGSPASFWLRAGAFFIDGLVTAVAVFPLFLAADAIGRGHYVVKALIYVLPFFAARAAYFTWMPVARRGQTIGKKIAGIAIIPEGPGPLTYGQTFRRYLGYIADGLTLMFGYLLALRTEENRALHDLIAETRVVYVEDVPARTRKAVAWLGMAGAVFPAIALGGMMAAILIPLMSKRSRPAAIGVAAHFLPPPVPVARPAFSAARPTSPPTPLPPSASPAFRLPRGAAAVPQSAPITSPISKSAEEAAKDLMAVVASETLQAIRAAQPAATAPVNTLYTAGDLRDPFSKISASEVVPSRPFDPAKDVSLDDLSLVGVMRGPKSSEALFADKRFGVNLILRWGRLYYGGGRSGIRRGRSVLGTSIPGVTGAIMSKQGVILRRGIESRVFVLGSKVVVLGGSGKMASL